MEFKLSTDKDENKIQLTQEVDKTSNPAPLGLMAFGMTTVLLNLHNAGIFNLGSMILAMGMFYGGTAQVIAGIMEYKKSNTFGTTAFISYGFFWLTLVGLIVMPKLGMAEAPEKSAMIAYLLMWGLFTAGMFVGTFKISRALQVVFGSLTLLFLKKGPNDPFISLRSRKARVVGDWIISKYNMEYTNIYIDGEQYYYKLAQDGKGIAETKKFTNSPHDTTWTWSGKITVDRGFNFDKHGKVIYKYHYTISQFYPEVKEDAAWAVDSTISYERIYYRTGTWNFLHGIDGFKNSERLSIMWEYKDFEQIWNKKVDSTEVDADDPLTITINTSKREQKRSYFDIGEDTEVWILDKLKSKELMMYRKIDQNTKLNIGSAAIENTTRDGLEQYDLEQE